MQRKMMKHIKQVSRGLAAIMAAVMVMAATPVDVSASAIRTYTTTSPPNRITNTVNDEIVSFGVEWDETLYLDFESYLQANPQIVLTESERTLFERAFNQAREELSGREGFTKDYIRAYPIITTKQIFEDFFARQGATNAAHPLGAQVRSDEVLRKKTKNMRSWLLSDTP